MSAGPVYHATTGSMCFASALVSLKAGGLVRRKSWPALTWIGITDGRLLFRLRNGEHENWSRLTTDLLAEDWEEALVPYGVKP